MTRRERVAVADRLAATGDWEFARPSGNTLASTSAAFDGEGDQLSATDAAGNSTAFTYDPTGLVTGEVQPVTSSSGITTSFGYDPAGNQTLYTDGNGSPWQYTYNSWGLQESRIEPATSQYSGAANSTFTTAYDADQNPVTESEPGGVTVTDTYNKLDELTGQSGSGADAATPARTFGYDTNGNLTSATTSNTAGSGSNATSETFTYNDRGEVLTASGSGGSTTYGYNGDGQAASVADAAGTTSYTYDNAGRLVTLADPATGTTAAYSYNPDSQVSAISYGPGNDSQSFGYDSQRRLASDRLKASTGTVVASVGYGYNADGQVASETSTGLASPASSTYTYDEAGRLTSWLNGTTTTQYGYDGNGNLTRGGAKTYTYDARDELTSDGAASYTYTARGTASSESSPSGTIAVSFDAYGDQATAGTRAYGYDALGRLTADTPAAGGSGYQFSYAGKTGTVASNGTSAYAWDPSGSVLAGVGAPGGGTGGVLALTDAHGDVLGQFTAGGTGVLGSQAYDPWGTVTATTGTMTGMLGFQSAWSDPASGKDLMGARWYNPAAGDFTSADSVQVSPVPDPAAGNPFGYAAGNPLSFTDPTGHYVDPGGSARDNPGYTDQVTYSLAYTAQVWRVGPVRAAKAATAATARVHAVVKATNAQIAAAQKKAQKAKAARQLAAQKAAAKRKATTRPNPRDKPYLLPVGARDAFINPGALDLGTGIEIYPEGDLSPLNFINPGAPELGTGKQTTPIADQGPIVNASDGTDSPTTEDVVPDLPAYAGGKTSGVLVRPDGTEVPLESGYNGPALDLPKPRPGMNGNIVSHVEAHASAIMRNDGLNEAFLYINRMPCPGVNGCLQNLSRMVPSGSTLNIYVMPQGSGGDLKDWIIVKGAG